MLLLGKFGVLLFYQSTKQQFQLRESNGSVGTKTEGALLLLLDMCWQGSHHSWVASEELGTVPAGALGFGYIVGMNWLQSVALNWR